MYRSRCVQRVSRLLSMLLLSIVISSCQTNTAHLKSHKTQYTTALSEMRSTISDAIANDAELAKREKASLPDSVNKAMLPAISVGDLVSESKESSEEEKRFDVSVKNMPAKSFFMSLVKDTPYSMVVSPDLTGNVTLRLKNVTIPETLNAVKDAYGYQYELTSYGFRILSNSGLLTHVFSVSYLNVRRSGHSNTMISSGDITSKIGVNGKARAGDNSQSLYNNQNADSSASTSILPNLSASNSSSGAGASGTSSSTVRTESRANFWGELKRTLQSLITDASGSSVVVNPDAGLVIVKTYPKNMSEVEQYLESLQEIMTRQVIIDAKILEVELTDAYDAGVDWSLLGAQQQGTLAFPLGSLTGFKNDLTASIFTLSAAGKGQFSTVIKLLSTQGNVQVLSSPRIATLNNQKAVIKVGQDQFFVTNFKTLTLASAGATDQSQDIEMTPFFSGIALDVTPEIDNDKNVTLHIHPIVSQVTDDKKVIDLGTGKGTVTLPMAISQVRESDSIVRAHDSQVIVIGGLMENKTSENVAKVPGLGDIPYLGKAFRRTYQEAHKTELVILLKPMVVNPKTWRQQLHHHQNVLAKMHRGFHFGGHPKVFGTRAEQGS